MTTKLQFKLSMDGNGNKTLYCRKPGDARKSAHQFKIQTNGNLPKTHGMPLSRYLDRWTPENLYSMFREVKAYVAEHGTDHQKQVLVGEIDPTDVVERIHSELNQYCVAGLHGILWQLLVNEAHKSKRKAFTRSLMSERDPVRLAFDSGGYIETGIYLKPELDDDQADRVIASLNQMTFDLSEHEATTIVCHSMRG